MGDDALGAWRQQSMTCTVLRSIGLIVCLVVSGRAGGFGGIGQFFSHVEIQKQVEQSC